MPSRDLVHVAVRNALVKDGWTITHDPLLLAFGHRNVYVDLGAEAPLAAEREGRKIAVEVKSFVGTSEVVDLERALGQFLLYGFLLERKEPDRTLYLAISRDAYDSLFSEPEGRDLIPARDLRIIVFHPTEEVILEWIEPPATQTS